MDNEELKALGILNEESNNRKDNDCNHDYDYVSLLVTSVLIPIIGFIVGIFYIDSNNKLARTCIQNAWIGTVIFVIIMFVFYDSFQGYQGIIY